MRKIIALTCLIAVVLGVSVTALANPHIVPDPYDMQTIIQSK